MLLPYAASPYAGGNFVFYLIQYTLTTVDAFLIVLAMGYVTVTRRHGDSSTDMSLLSDLAGQILARPALALCFTVCLFSIAGVPPLVGFVAKAAVLKGSLMAGDVFLSVLAIVVSVISGSYYLKLIRLMVFEPLPQTSIVTRNNLDVAHTMAIAVLTLLQVLFMLDSQTVLTTTDLIGLQLGIS